jgi:hypothetical protein
VLWIDEEGSEDILAERLKLFGVKPDYLDGKVRYALNQSVRLDDPASRTRLFAEMEAFRPDIVVIDSFTHVHGGDENASREMGAVFAQAIKPLSRTYGATVIIIDHTAKTYGGTTASLRGSTEKRNQVDRVWVLKAGSDDTFALRHDKARRGVAPKPVTIRRAAGVGSMQHVLYTDTRDDNSAVTVRLEQLLDFLNKYGETDRKTILERFGNNGTTKAALRLGKDQGKLKSTNTRPSRYSLVETPTNN